jgi:hypothetical protein
MVLQERLAHLLKCISGTCEDELDGTAWDVIAAHVAEALLHGEPLTPAIQRYLDNSPDCREEFYALVAILKSEQQIGNVPMDSSV